MPKFERSDMFDHVLGRTIRPVPDSTGVKLDNRGEWISVKWKVKRGFFKMHILADLDTRRILAFSLADMKGGDAAQLPDLPCLALGGYAGSGVSMPKPVAKMVLNAAPEGNGLRRMVGIIISVFKRMFGESVRALAPCTAFIEAATKAAAYNRNLDIGDEAIREETNRRAQACGAVTA